MNGIDKLIISLWIGMFGAVIIATIFNIDIISLRAFLVGIFVFSLTIV